MSVAVGEPNFAVECVSPQPHDPLLRNDATADSRPDGGYTESAMQQLHVRPSEAGWQVELEGRMTSEFPTQVLAWSAAKALARQVGVRLSCMAGTAWFARWLGSKRRPKPGNDPGANA